MFGERNNPVVDAEAVIVVDGGPEDKVGEGIAAGDFDLFGIGFLRAPGDFDEKVGDVGRQGGGRDDEFGVGGAEDGEGWVEVFRVDEVFGQRDDLAGDSERWSGVNASRGTFEVVVGNGLEVEASQGFDIKVGAPTESSGAAGGFVKSRVVPGVEREFEVEDGGFVGAGVQEDGFVGIDFRWGGFRGAGFEDAEAGDGGRDE